MEACGLSLKYIWWLWLLSCEIIIGVNFGFCYQLLNFQRYLLTFSFGKPFQRSENALFTFFKWEDKEVYISPSIQNYCIMRHSTMRCVYEPNNNETLVPNEWINQSCVDKNVSSQRKRRHTLWYGDVAGTTEWMDAHTQTSLKQFIQLAPDYLGSLNYVIYVSIPCEE